MCRKLFQTCILDISLILTSSLQVSYYYYPHFTDEKVRHRNVKQSAQGHTAGKHCWILTRPEMLPPIIFFPFSLGYSLTMSCTLSQVLLLGMAFLLSIFSCQIQIGPGEFPDASRAVLPGQDSPLIPSASLCPPLFLLLPEKNALPDGPSDRMPCPCVGVPPTWGVNATLPTPELCTLPGRSRCSGNGYWIEHMHIKYRRGDKWLFPSSGCRENC